MASPLTISIFDHELPDDSHNHYDVIFFENTISTLVTNTPSSVDSWISDIERIHRRRLDSLIVGLVVEWRPNQSRNIENQVAVLQLCVGRRCLVFQILHSPTIPSSLKNFLNNPAYTFAGVGIDNDVEKLTEDYNLAVAKTADVRELAAERYGVRELKNSGLKELTFKVLGKEISKRKGVTMSRWDNPCLTPAQVQYACIDAFLSFEIGRILISGCAISIFNHELYDDSHNLYNVTFFENIISTLVTKTPSYVDSWISDTERIHRRGLHSLIVGLDVEWRPNQSRNIQNPVALLQLCVGHRCLVFQILHSPTIPSSLKNFLNNPAYTFAGVGIDNDVEKLTEDYDLAVAKTADVRGLAAKQYGVRELKNSGLKGLAFRVLGKEISKPKGVTLSRWDDSWLTPAQVQYACIDAFLSFDIARILISGNQN